MRILSLFPFLFLTACTSKTEHTVATLVDGERKFSLDSYGTLHGADGLSNSQKQTVAALLGGSPFPQAPHVKELLHDVYDSKGEETIEILEPRQIVTPTNQPVFRWKAVQGVANYEVMVRDHRDWVVRQSGKLEGTEWTPPKPLAEGDIFSWQVVAADKRVSHWVRFAVPGSAALEEISTVMAMKPGSHLLLAIAYGRCGAVGHAAGELYKLDGELAKSWREQLR